MFKNSAIQEQVSLSKPKEDGNGPFVVDFYVAFGLAVSILIQAFVCILPLGLSTFDSVPFSRLLQPDYLPPTLCIGVLIWTFLSAPLWTYGLVKGGKGRHVSRESILRCCSAGIWQSVLFLFFLTWAGRLTPLSGMEVFSCVLVVGLTAFTAAMGAFHCRRIYPGTAFLWALVIPLACYVTAEVYLYGPAGGKGNWSQAVGMEESAGSETISPEPIGIVVHYALTISPGTAGSGALKGRVVDGVDWNGNSLLIFILGIILLNGFVFIVSKRKSDIN